MDMATLQIFLLYHANGTCQSSSKLTPTQSTKLIKSLFFLFKEENKNPKQNFTHAQRGATSETA